MLKRLYRIISTRKIIWKANKNGSSVWWGTGIDSETVFEGKNATYKGSACPGSHLGYASYIGMNTKLSRTWIGRFCSIAGDVSIIYGNHPTRNYVSTHAAFYDSDGFNNLCYTDAEHHFTEQERNPFVEGEHFLHVGNDVWIGKGVKIKCGVKIGNGAIVGAYAVVTKDVPPYAIVGGIPAKLIRYRFAEADIKWLQELRWWDKDTEWLEKYGSYFYDIQEVRKQTQ